MRSFIAITLIFCLLPSGAFADSVKSSTETPIVQTKIAKTKALASLYGLDIKEWKRYELLKKGPAGLKNANMHPAMMLGMYAKNDSERRHFARIYNQSNYEYISKTREWQNSVISDFHTNYPDAKVIDLQGMYIPGRDSGASSEPVNYVPNINDSVALFVGLDCDQCEATYRKLVKLLPSIKLHIHFDTDDENAIREWAVKNKVPPKFTRQKIITLNKAGTLIEDWGITSFPSLLKKSKGEKHYERASL